MDSHLERTIAIEIQNKAASEQLNPSRHSNFLKEAVTTGELDHPNIVPVYDLDINSDGHLFLVAFCRYQEIRDQENYTASLEDLINSIQRQLDIRAFALGFKSQQLTDQTQHMAAPFAGRDDELNPVGKYQ